MHRILRLRHNFLSQNYTTLILIIAVLIFGFLLRINRFDTIPRTGATFDEFAWTWLGLNIINDGVPRSWSPHPQYETREHLVYLGARFNIVEPYLEHPPLFGLIAGGFAKINGVENMLLVTTYKIRPLAIAMGTLSIFLIFLFSKNLWGKSIGLLSAVLFSSLPTVVIGSRIVQNENFLIPVWIASLYLIWRYIKYGNKKVFFMACILSGLVSLAKVPWLVVWMSLFLILSYKNKWKEALVLTAVVAGIFSLFIAWGLAWDAMLFKNLWLLQIARYDLHFAGFFSLFTSPLLIDRFYIDGWVYFGWFSIFVLSKKFEKYYLLLIPFFSYLFVYLFAIPDEPGHGWYRYPFLPFLIISIAIYISEEFKKPTLSQILFILLVGFGLLNNVWTEMFGFSYVVLRIFLCMSFLTILGTFWFPKFEKYKKNIFITWIVIFLFFNILSIIVYIE